MDGKNLMNIHQGLSLFFSLSLSFFPSFILSFFFLTRKINRIWRFGLIREDRVENIEVNLRNICCCFQFCFCFLKLIESCSTQASMAEKHKPTFIIQLLQILLLIKEDVVFHPSPWIGGDIQPWVLNSLILCFFASSPLHATQRHEPAS